MRGFFCLKFLDILERRYHVQVFWRYHVQSYHVQGYHVQSYHVQRYHVQVNI